MFQSSVRRSFASAAAVTVAVGAVLLIAPTRAPAAGPLSDAAEQTATSSVRSARYASIPDSAMLPSLVQYEAEPLPADAWPALRPPQPCADGPYRSAALRRVDRTVSGLVGVGERPTVLVEHVTIYRANGAQSYLRQLRRALDRCAGTDARGTEWTVLATGVAGRDSLLLRMREEVDYGDRLVVKDTYLAVARVGRAVVVVADVGWEDGDGHEPLVRESITTAVRQASILR